MERKSVKDSFLLLSFFLYICLGNTTRVVSIGLTGVSLYEVIFYAISLLCLVFDASKIPPRVILGYTVFVLIVSLSNVIGIYKNGFLLNSTLYAGRLMVQVASSVAIGMAASRMFKFDCPKLIKYFLFTYFILCLLGFAIFIAFPESVELWRFLERFGIRFEGDPHRFRFYSTLFDPNFFACIIVYPLSLLIVTRPYIKGIYFNVLAFTFLVCFGLTFSRSGFGTLVLTLGMVSVLSTFSGNIKIFKNILVFVPIFLVFLLIAGGLFSEELERFVQRFQKIEYDSSAYRRLVKAKIGLEYFKQAPVFGWGFNYSGMLVANAGLNALSFDSSVQTVFVCFGFILGAFISGGLIFMVYRVRRTLSRTGSSYLRACGDVTLSYVFVCMFFSANFINLLLYQFWIIPVFSLCFFFIFSSDTRHAR